MKERGREGEQDRERGRERKKETERERELVYNLQMSELI